MCGRTEVLTGNSFPETPGTSAFSPGHIARGFFEFIVCALETWYNDDGIDRNGVFLNQVTR
jgi:hypothetical protein